MSDPFGALATQRKGDVGIFDGAQYRPSSSPYAFDLTALMGKATLRSSDSATAIVTGGIPGVNNNEARRLTILDGSVTHPVTDNYPTAYVSREQAWDGRPVYNNATAFQAVAEARGAVNGYGQIQAIYGWAANNLSDCDAAAVQGTAFIMTGALSSLKPIPDGVRWPTCYGMFAEAVSDDPYGFACGINPFVAIASTQPYTTLAPFSAGVFTQNSPLSNHIGHFTATISNASPAVFTKTAHALNNGDSIKLTGTPPTGLSVGTYFVINAAVNTFNVSATLGGSAINTTSSGSMTVTPYTETGPAHIAYSSGPENARWSQGFLSPAGAVDEQSFATSDSATTGYWDSGSHQNSIDVSNATVTGLHVKIGTNAGLLYSSGLAILSFETGYGVIHDTATHLTEFFGAGSVLGYIKGNWTPAAGETAWHMYGGVGPTDYQIKFVDPGAAGINLTAGQRVMVLA